MIGKLLLCFWILGCISLYGERAVAQEWPMPLDESADEKNDAEIFRAVVESMRQWTLQKQLHHRIKREISKVCYEDVGCFEDTGPFSYLEMLPSPPKDVGTRFLVYGSRKARSIPMEVPADDINDSAHRAIDPDLPTKVIVHGFGSSCDHVWVYEMRSALMTVQECNIVCVDWGPGSAVPNYVRAAANTRLVGRQLAKLVKSLNVPLERVHLIGFSLGAHVAGFAGAELGNVSRITGLDPAGPLFESQDPRARLDKTDANFVDVIHSNGEQLLLGGLGSWQPMGDVDFYPNGGRMQTGCSNLFLGAVSDIIWSSAVEGRSLCNHRRAYKLFTDSVSPKCRFPAFPCDNGYDGLLRGECFPCGLNGAGRPCGDMGYYSDESPARGQLYLVTRDEEPFCAHQYQVKVYNSHSERPTRSYGKLQVTFVGDGLSFNDSFAMTRKDEELLVGKILQKIVVPHPAISNFDAIEIKYTAYSGWISSGLVSWSIDKVSIVDSFGKTLSVCRKGLSLESGKPVYLPLFAGECNVPAESENATSPDLGRLLQESKAGIGPFTKEQNYEAKDGYSNTFSTDHRATTSSSSKGLGPFTKEQNLRIIEGKENFKSNSFEDQANNRRGSSNPWNIVDISADGDSNSLENSDSERGRGFSGSNYFANTQPPNPPVDTSTESLPEIREPVLKVNKKETGRSLKFPEITEPILRPRSARQNIKDEAHTREKQRDEIQEAPSTTRSFTVQFLPERLAGILAQAERYARQTLLPLISQYTPSFVTGTRYEEPKYFPPLGEIASEDRRGSIEPEYATNSDRERFESQNRDEQIGNTESVPEEMTRIKNTSEVASVEVPAIVEAVYSEDSGANSTKIDAESNEWLPMESSGTSSRKDLNVSRSMNWEYDKYNWSTRTISESSSLRPEVDDWVPITVKSDELRTTESSGNFSNEVSLPRAMLDAQMDTATVTDTRDSDTQEAVTSEKEERKYIPLIDTETKESSSTSSNDIHEARTSAPVYSHIQRIPKPIQQTRSSNSKADGSTTRRSMAFPYAYERKKDPRTRYIPLIPEEDIGRPRFSVERER